MVNRKRGRGPFDRSHVNTDDNCRNPRRLGDQNLSRITLISHEAAVRGKCSFLKSDHNQKPNVRNGLIKRSASSREPSNGRTRTNNLLSARPATKTLGYSLKRFYLAFCADIFTYLIYQTSSLHCQHFIVVI